MILGLRRSPRIGFKEEEPCNMPDYLVTWERGITLRTCQLLERRLITINISPHGRNSSKLNLNLPLSLGTWQWDLTLCTVEPFLVWTWNFIVLLRSCTVRNKVMEMWHILKFYYQPTNLWPVWTHHRTRARVMMVLPTPDRGIKTLGSQDQGFRTMRQESCWCINVSLLLISTLQDILIC